MKNKLSLMYTGEGNPFYGKQHSQETRLKISEIAKLKVGDKNPFYGKHHSEKTKKKLVISTKNLWKNKEYREKTIRNILRGLYNRPTSFEIKLKEILDKLQPNEWKYTGDGSFLIGYKNPDFINVNGKKICIEVYYHYFKEKDFGSCENYEKQRSEYFAKYGWDTIFINQNQLNKESIMDLLNFSLK